MKKTHIAAVAALALGATALVGLSQMNFASDTSAPVQQVEVTAAQVIDAPIVQTHATRATDTSNLLERLSGDNPRFDYTMWLNPDLQLSESTVEPGLSTLERYRRLKEATVYIENTKAEAGSANSLGSGVIIDNQNCWVISNDHVTEGADFLDVSYVNGWLPDGTPLVEQVSATIIGHPGDSERGFDLTLLQMDSCVGAAWAPILTDHTDVKDGEMSVAVGNPLGQTWTLTKGVISHNSRFMRGNNPWPMIQTDASVNRGNSGGPLFDQHGYVIGINTLILSQSGDNNGIAMSIRSDLLRLFLNNVYTYGQMQVNQIGVQINGISKAEAEIMDIPGGILIDSVVEGTPAAEAGIQKGDIITHVDGTLVTSTNRIIMKVWSADPNVGAHARIVREQADGTREVLEMTIPVRNVWESTYTAPEADAYTDQMGWTIEDSDQGGVSITEVARMGPAHRLGMEPRDISESRPPESVKIGDRNFIVTITVEGSEKWIVTGVKAQGRERLNLTNLVGVAPNAASEALEAYIRSAGGEPVVLYIDIIRGESSITAKRVGDRTVELPEETLRKLYQEYGLTRSDASTTSIVLFAQPKAYPGAVDLDNWVPPATGN